MSVGRKNERFNVKFFFFVKKIRKRKKEEASPQAKNRAMWGEEAKPLKHKMMLRGSLTSDKNKCDRSCWAVPRCTHSAYEWGRRAIPHKSGLKRTKIRGPGES